MKNKDTIEEIFVQLSGLDEHVNKLLALTTDMHRGAISEDVYYREKDFSKAESSHIRNRTVTIRKLLSYLKNASQEIDEFAQLSSSSTYAADSILKCLSKKEMRKFHALEAFITYAKLSKEIPDVNSILAKDVVKEEKDIVVDQDKKLGTDAREKYAFLKDAPIWSSTSREYYQDAAPFKYPPPQQRLDVSDWTGVTSSNSQLESEIVQAQESLIIGDGMVYAMKDVEATPKPKIVKPAPPAPEPFAVEPTITIIAQKRNKVISKKMKRMAKAPPIITLAEEKSMKDTTVEGFYSEAINAGMLED